MSRNNHFSYILTALIVLFVMPGGGCENEPISLDEIPAISTFFTAIKEGDVEEIKRAIELGIDINAKDPDGNPPLVIAAESGSTAVIDALLEAKGILINETGASGEPPLIVAVKNSNLEAVKALLDAPEAVVPALDLSIADADGNPPLVAAVRTSSAEVVTALVENPTIAETINTKVSGLTPLHHLLSTRTDATKATATANVLKALLSTTGIEVNKADEDGKTALHHAVSSQNALEPITELLKVKDDLSVNLCTIGESPATALSLLAEREVTAVTIAAGFTQDVKNAISSALGVAQASADCYYPAVSETDFLSAATNGDLTTIDQAIKSGETDINVLNSEGNTALILAAQRGHTEVVARLLEEADTQADLKGEAGNTALIFAIKGNHSEVAKALLNLDRSAEESPKIDEVGINLANTAGETAFYLAAKGSNDKSLIEKILAYTGFSGHVAGPTDSTTPLIAAVLNNNYRVVTALVENPTIAATINTPVSGLTPLHHLLSTRTDAAEATATANVLSALLSTTGIDVSIVDGDGNTPLIAAVLNNNYRVVTALVENTTIAATINTKVSGLTPLAHLLSTRTDAAEATATANVLSALLSTTGIDVNIADDEGKAALHHAVLSQNAWKPIKALLEGGRASSLPLKINLCVDVDGTLTTALSLLDAREVDATFTETVKDEIKTGLGTFSLTETCGDEVIPPPTYTQEQFLAAVRANDVNTVKAAVNGSIQVNKGTYEKSPLGIATERGNLEVIKVLLEVEDILVNEADDSGNTPLVIAAESGSAEVIKALLEAKGILINEAGASGESPLIVAVKNSNLEAVKALLDAPEAVVPALDLSIADTDGNPPLVAAVRTSSAEVVTALVENPTIAATINTKVSGLTPLHHLLSTRTDATKATATANVLKALLSTTGVDVSIADASGKTPLIAAVLTSSAEVVTALVENTAIVATINTPVSGLTPLAHLLSTRTDATKATATANVLGALLRTTGIDVNTADASGKAALHHAVLSQNAWKPIKALLEGSRASRLDLKINLCAGDKTALALLDARGVDATFTQAVKNAIKTELGTLGLTATCGDEVPQPVVYTQVQFVEAVRANDINTVVAAVQQEGDAIDVNSGSSENPPLLVAAKAGYTEIVKVLLGVSDILVNKGNAGKETALYWAASKGFAEVVKALLEHSEIEVNQVPSLGETAFFTAAKRNRLEVVKALLMHPDIDVNIKNKGEQTPLMWVSRHGHVEVAKILLSKTGIEVNAISKGFSGVTALTWAARYGRVGVVRFLLSGDYPPPAVEPNKKNGDGDPPFFLAASKGFGEVVQLFLNLPVDVNMTNSSGHTALHEAAFNGHAPVIKILLKAEGIEVNKKSNIGFTALHRAGQSRSISLELTGGRFTFTVLLLKPVSSQGTC